MRDPGLLRKILIRTRGNHQQGMGDLVGSEAVGRAFLSQGMEVTILAEPDPEATAYLEKTGLAHLSAGDIFQDCRIVREWAPDCLVINMLRSAPDYLESLRPLVRLLVTVDDDGPGAALADLCINPLYPIPGALASPAFIPLKPEFQELNRQPRTWRAQVQSILITLGGADTYGFSPLVVRALASIPEGISLKVILGPAFRHEAEMTAALKDLAGRPGVVERNVADMGPYMAEADLAICSGGLTLFEMACVGTPAIVVCGEPFEVGTASRLAALGFGVNLGFGGDCTEAAIRRAVMDLINDGAGRAAMGRRGRELVDGRGAQRSMGAICEKWQESVKVPPVLVA
jgi:spore coat polysaccharide biosynthesis predicted glycosyltransferase SpsG